MTSTMKNHRKHTVHSGNNSLRELRQQAAEIGDTVRSMAKTAGQAAGDSLGPIENYVREKPLKSLAMAAGAGILLGLFLLRR